MHLDHAWEEEDHWAQAATRQKAEAEARLQKLADEREGKQFLQSYQRKEEKLFKHGWTKARNPNDFFRRTLSQVGWFSASFQETSTTFRSTGFRSTWQPASPAVRRIMFGSTNGMDRGLRDNRVTGRQVPETELRQAFSEIDRDKDGLVSKRDIIKAIRKCGIDASKENVERLLEESGYGAEGKLRADQFVHFFRTVEKLSLLELNDDLIGCSLGACGRCLMFALLIAASALLLLVVRAEQEAAEGVINDSKRNTLWLAFMFCGFSALPLVLCGVVWPLLRCCSRSLCKDCCVPEEEYFESDELPTKQGKPSFATTISWLESSVERQHGRVPSSMPSNPIGAGFVDSETPVQAYDPSQYLAARANALQAAGYRVPSSAPATRAATPQATQGAVWSTPRGAVLANSPSSYGGAFSAGALSGYAVPEAEQPNVSSSPAKWEPRPAGYQQEAWSQASPVSPLSAWLQTSRPGAAGSVVTLGHQREDEGWGTLDWQLDRGGENMSMHQSALPAVPESREFGSNLHGDLELLDCD